MQSIFVVNFHTDSQTVRDGSRNVSNMLNCKYVYLFPPRFDTQDMLSKTAWRKKQNIIFIMGGGACHSSIMAHMILPLSQDESVIGSSYSSDFLCQFFISSIVRTSFLYVATCFPSGGKQTNILWLAGQRSRLWVQVIFTFCGFLQYFH